MGRALKDLGLSPELSHLPSNVLDLIQNGNCGEHPDRWEDYMAVCVAMFRAGYNVAEVWMVMTDPANGISEKFFEEDGERAEAHLELIISETYEANPHRRVVMSSVSAAPVAPSGRARKYGYTALLAHKSIIIVANEASASCFSGGGQGGAGQDRARAPPRSGGAQRLEPGLAGRHGIGEVGKTLIPSASVPPFK